MPRITRPEVSSPELRAALDRVGSHIENYNENLDRLSNDIRAIEQYLTASGVRQWAYVTIGQVEDELTDGDLDEAGFYSGGIARNVENIEWGPVNGEEGSRWRVVYHKFRVLGRVDICDQVLLTGPAFTPGGTTIERKPLIETPASTRLQAHKSLATLVERIGQLVEFTPMAGNTNDNGGDQ